MNLMKEAAVIFGGLAGSLAIPIAQGTPTDVWALFWSFVERLGFPAAIIFAGCLALWRIGRWLAPIVKEWGDRWIESNEKLTDSNIEANKTNAEANKVNAETLRKMEVAMAAQTTVLHRMETTLNTVVEVKKQTQQLQQIQS